MTHPNPERLSDYLDGDLPAGDVRLLEAHLAVCAECAALLSEIRRVVARAQALEERPPRADLWPGVAAAIGSGSTHGRRFAFSVPQLLAAGIAIMILSGGAVALALRGSGDPVARQDPGAPPAVLPAAARQGYDAAVRRLEGELHAMRGRLDSTTIRVVEEKLKLIDQAMLEAERALASDPANAYLQGHLTSTRLRKLDLLRRTAALTRSL